MRPRFWRTVRLALSSGPRPPGSGTKRALALAAFVPAYLALQAIHRLAFLVDELFYSGYRDVKLQPPLFVVGVPRSGTSFLHRTLAEDEARFTTPRLWELLFAPSVSERRFWFRVGRLDRRLGSPGRRFLGTLERAFGGRMRDVHPVSLQAPGEDYFLLLPVFACFLLVVAFPLHPELWKLTHFDDLPEHEREPLIDFYEAQLKRHVYAHRTGKRVLSKNPSFTPWVRSLHARFPDARIVCCLRDPIEFVPSQLSSLRPGAEAFGYDVGAPEIRDRFVDMLEHFVEHATSVLDTLPEDRYSYVSLPDLSRDPEAVIMGLYERFGWRASDALQARLADRTESSRAYRSRHAYSLDEFGLERAVLARRFGPLERFGLVERGASAR